MSEPPLSKPPPTRFAAIGLNHGHIYGMTRALLGAGAELAGFYAPEDDLAAQYEGAFPQAERVTDRLKLLEDERIALIVSAAIPSERAEIGLAALQHGKDFLADKPGFVTLEALSRHESLCAETGRKSLVYFSERFENRATVRASQLVEAGAIGAVVHTVGLGPHRVGLFPRPDWFYDTQRAGGILTDVASHQLDGFLFFTRSERARITAASVANRAHPEYPAFMDVGDLAVQSDKASGLVRVDWLTPEGLGVWGDGRLFLVGTEGTIELRKLIDPAGREGGDHLILVNGETTEYIDCQNEALPFARQLLGDIHSRTETAVTQAHTFTASRLAIEAQTLAERSLEETS